MSLRTLIQSLARNEVLLPVLYRFLAKKRDQLAGKAFKDKRAVIHDAEMTIRTFKRRMDEYNHDVKLDQQYFHPSQLGQCMRALWFAEKGAPQEERKEDVESLFRMHMIFETGTYVGVVFQNLCARAGVLLQREVPIQSKALRIIGHADGLLRIDGVKYVLEIKTCNTRIMAKVKKAGEPLLSHKRQLMAYMEVLGVKWGIVIYLGKDRHDALEYVVQYDKSFAYTEVTRRIKTYFRSLENNVVPVREGLSPSSDVCKWCAFKRVCFDSRSLAHFVKKTKATKQDSNEG